MSAAWVRRHPRTIGDVPAIGRPGLRRRWVQFPRQRTRGHLRGWSGFEEIMPHRGDRLMPGGRSPVCRRIRDLGELDGGEILEQCGEQIIERVIIYLLTI